MQILNQIPLQQGLKLSCDSDGLNPRPNSKSNSTTTRIETRFKRRTK